MKKIMLAAAMCVAFAAPPAFAADMGTTPTNDEVTQHIKCSLLPLLPECIEYWKAKADEAKAKWDEAMSK